MSKYDYLIVGCGLFGSVFAREMTDLGRKCLVIEKRAHIGGNCYTEKIEGITAHKYGPHIFHTTDLMVRRFIEKYGGLNNFRYKVKVCYGGNIYSFPINLMTLYQLWGVSKPDEAREVMAARRVSDEDTSNVEGWCLSNIGDELYEIFVRGYTKKQWGCEPRLLPSSIIERIPIRFTYSDNYFDDCAFQGLPEIGYNQLFSRLLDGIELHLGVDYLLGRNCWDALATKVLFTGRIDQFFNYCFGELPYRSLRFEHAVFDETDHQGIPAFNWTEEGLPFTRTVEYKYFDFSGQDRTVVTKEFPSAEGEPFYPLETSENLATVKSYFDLYSKNPGKYLFGGRLATYKYLDMDQVIKSALEVARRELGFDNSGRVGG